MVEMNAQTDTQSTISLKGDPNMLLSIKILGLSTRANNALVHYADRPIEFIGQLLTKNLVRLNRIHHLGAKTIGEIADTLAAKGYKIGEADGQVTGIECHFSDNLRKAYDIPDDVVTPTEWVAIPGREPISLPKGQENQMLTRKFTDSIYCHLPYEVTDEANIAAIQGVCQKAFEIAVDHAIDVARSPTTQPNLAKILKKKLPSFKPVIYTGRTGLSCPVSLSEQMTELFKEGALGKIVNAIDFEVKCGLVMSVLEPKN